MTAAAPTGISYRLPQERRLVTELPGPASRALATRRARAVAAGLRSSVPVYAADADGGVIVDVDGNSLIDLGSGIAVTSVGASEPRGGGGGGRTGAAFHAHLLHGHPVRGLCGGGGGAQRADTR